MKSRAREQASSSIPLQGRHERGAEKNGKQMRSQGASRSENHDGKQQDMTTHARTEREIRQTNQTRTRTQQPQVQNKRYTKTPPRAAQGSGKRKKEVVHLVLCSSVQFSSVRVKESPFPARRDEHDTSIRHRRVTESQIVVGW